MNNHMKFLGCGVLGFWGFVVCIVPMCCLSSTSNKEHTFKVMRGGYRGNYPGCGKAFWSRGCTVRDVSGPARLCMKRGALWEEVGRPTIVSWVSQQIHQYKNRWGGMCWYWGILFDEGWSFIRRSPLNVVVASKILYGSRVGNVPCSSDIGCIQK